MSEDGAKLRTFPLDQFASVTLDGNGNGLASLGPTRVKEHWQPISTYVSVSSNTKEATAKLSIGTTAQTATNQATTALGSTGDTCGTPGADMPAGYRLFVQWEGGDPGALATMHTLGQIVFGYGQ